MYLSCSGNLVFSLPTVRPTYALSQLRHFDICTPFLRYLIWICLHSSSVVICIVAWMKSKSWNKSWHRTAASLYTQLVLSKTRLPLRGVKFNSMIENLNFYVLGWSFNCPSKIVRYRAWTLGGNKCHFPFSDVNYHWRRPAFIGFSGVCRLFWPTRKWKYGGPVMTWLLCLDVCSKCCFKKINLSDFRECWPTLGKQFCELSSDDCCP